MRSDQLFLHLKTIQSVLKVPLKYIVKRLANFHIIKESLLYIRNHTIFNVTNTSEIKKFFILIFFFFSFLFTILIVIIFFISFYITKKKEFINLFGRLLSLGPLIKINNTNQIICRSHHIPIKRFH